MKIISNNNIDALNNKITTKNYLSGELVEEGFYKCCNCGQKVYLDVCSKLSQCSRCNCSVFEKVK